ncbi:MAG: oligosaccharide flippase family protein [Pyrinomonadaceae bacterium]
MAIDQTKEEVDTPDAIDTPPIGRDLFWTSWSGVITIANSILLWVFIARMRDVEELGRFTIVMGLYALFYSVCTLGLFSHLVAEITRRREDPDLTITFVSTATCFLAISGTGCAVLMSICGAWASESASVRGATSILSMALIPTALIGIAEAVALAYGRTRTIAFVTTLENVIRTVVPIALIWFGFSISAICISFVLIRCVSLVIYIGTARGFISEFSFSRSEFLRLAGSAPTFAGTIVLASINWQAAVILLSHFSTETESAKYGVASRFLIPVTILMASYANVIQPALVRAARSGALKTAIESGRAMRLPVLMFTGGAILSPFMSEWLLTILFGSRYADSAETLDILAVSAIPFCLVMIAARSLVAMHSQRVDLFANAIGVVVFLLAGSLWIPEHGAWGAALAQLLSFLFMTVVELGYISKKAAGWTGMRSPSTASVCMLAASLFMWNQ